MKVWQATEHDVDDIVRMSRDFYSTTTYRGYADFDEDTVRRLAETLASEHVMLIAELDGRVVGMVGLFVVPFLFNGARRMAHEVVWYVDPGAQGAGAGKALLAAIEPACRDKGADGIFMIHLSNSPPQAAEIYQRMGYAHSETVYVRTL
ncbi:GNAT family N-acetyltransferase [Luteimonas sp. 3794]|uniref:GNAT family N-acetyltransferase n=1 Tax=Luteimonas sp. 3794 TaxID=2817730 RepID=UPI002859B1F6|nr:GNAT family N-acetyltransferase [Luteimonas sp. 3794]MDR6992470.1 GNAT superfamily N-acetyltransferase [Luteimonas sp. 3794]